MLFTNPELETLEAILDDKEKALNKEIRMTNPMTKDFDILFGQREEVQRLLIIIMDELNKEVK